MHALQIASTLQLNDWCIAAGFVRNIVWDKLHNREELTSLNDLDVIFFDAGNTDPLYDKNHECRLRELSAWPWSVKNQARMHVRNEDSPYTSTEDAMSYWVEVETAIGVKVSKSGEIEIVAPFGVSGLFDYTITMNSKRPRLDAFNERVIGKKWLQQWPKLKVVS